MTVDTIDVIAITTALAILATLLGRIIKRPEWLHLVWLIVLIKFAVPVTLPISIGLTVSKVNDQKSLPTLAPAASPETSGPILSEQPPVSLSPPSDPQPSHEGSATTQESVSLAQSWSWKDVSMFVWTTGSLVWLLVMSHHLLRLRRQIRSAQAAPKDMCARATRIATSLGIRTLPRMVILRGSAAPFVVLMGRRPILSLSQKSLDHFDTHQLESVIAHELVHLKRCDHWVRWVEVLATTVFWWNPVLWWTRRQLSHWEEMACDAEVMRSFPHLRMAYATALAWTFETTSDTSPAMVSGLGADTKRLLQRLAAISNDASPSPTSRRVRVMLGLLGMVIMTVSIRGQEEEAAPSFRYVPIKDDEEALASALVPTSDSREVKRTVTVGVPAKRGAILDRHGQVLAGHRLAYEWAFPSVIEGIQLSGDGLATQLGEANRILGTSWEVNANQVDAHFAERPAVPYLFEHLLTEEQAEKLRTADLGMFLQSTIIRDYPHGELTGHVLGYLGKRTPASTGPLVEGELLGDDLEGKTGLEESFDAYLRGNPGAIEASLDVGEHLIQAEMIESAQRGKDLVTTLDLEMHQLASEIIANEKPDSSGGFVVMDPQTGEILLLHSWPGYDPNLFVPPLSESRFKTLREDPRHPLFGRAFQGSYSPGQAFKPFVALAGLNAGSFEQEFQIVCTGRVAIGNQYHSDPNHTAHGPIDLEGALMRGCHSWFYRAAQQMGLEPFQDMAKALGLGQPTGLPLPEGSGKFPNREDYGTDSFVIKMGIGYGDFTLTPLQTAQMMACLASGKERVHPRLLKDQPREATNLDWPERNVRYVRDAFIAATNATNSTTKLLAIPGVEMAAITSTGQWKEGRFLASAAGYLPAREPRYAFSLVLEGATGENIRGSKDAAPIVKAFFERWLTRTAR